MIDGIKISYELPNFQQWKEVTGITFNATINEDTGAIKQITRNDNKTGLHYTSIEHRAKFETYELTVNEITHTSKKTKYIVNISGSLHKNHFGGKNYSRFTFADLCTEINYLCLNLHLNAANCILKTFEYGLNLPVKFAPYEYLENNLISYNGKKLQEFETDSLLKIGFVCRLSEYRIKLYDKGLQHDLNFPLMRFEKAYKKLTSPKKLGIYTLDDLTKPNILKELQNELLEAWDKVFLFDSSLLTNVNLSDKEKIYLHHCRDPKFWKKTINRNQRKRNKNKYNDLLLRYGSNKNTHNEVKELLKQEFKMCTVLPTVKSEAEKQNVYGFTVNIDCKTVHIEKRYCKGCGKPLHPGQKKNSNFCSAKYVGYERAHKCRNNNSNPRNNFKNQFKKITGKGLLFDIIPFIDKDKRKFL